MTRTPKRCVLGRDSIVRRLAMGLALIAGVSTILTVALFGAVVRRAEEAEIQRNIVSTGKMMAKILAPSLWDRDMDRAAALGQALGQDPRVIRLTIRALHGETREIGHHSAPNVVTHRQPIVHGDRVLGEVEVAFSRALYTARADEGMRHAAIVGAVIFLIMLVGLRLLLVRMLRRPLDALTATVQRYADGDYTIGSRRSRFAEFEPFWSVMDVMATRIHNQLGELRDTNARLADEVQERRRAEENAWRSRNMLALVMNAVPQSIFWKDRDSVYLGANAVFAKWSGLQSPEDVVGRRDEDLPVRGKDPHASCSSADDNR